MVIPLKGGGGLEVIFLGWFILVGLVSYGGYLLQGLSGVSL